MSESEAGVKTDGARIVAMNHHSLGLSVRYNMMTVPLGTNSPSLFVQYIMRVLPHLPGARPSP